MRRLQLFGCIALSLMLGCSGCTSAFLKHMGEKAPDPRHRVNVLWVHDSVMAQLQAAARDSLESMWQVTAYYQGPLGQPANPGDLGFFIVGIEQCPAPIRGPRHVKADCPNKHAPTIHIHPSTGPEIDEAGNTCSPSTTDFAMQLTGRHPFDAIICGPNTRPTAFWFFENPLLGTAGFPNSLTPAIADQVAHAGLP